MSQIDRCTEILKKLTLNPIIEDNFIDRDLTMVEYITEIIKSLKKQVIKNLLLIMIKIQIH